jgi:cell wall-associated NlpC family hydrolase
MNLRFPLLAIGLLGMLATQCRAELLTHSEGQAVADVALRYGQSFRGEDCSHLAHHIYERAGLPYGYASSNSLYNGDPTFERVSAPQPGDLVVWRGHVGIVVNPQDAAFYSSLTRDREPIPTNRSTGSVVDLRASIAMTTPMITLPGP